MLIDTVQFARCLSKKKIGVYVCENCAFGSICILEKKWNTTNSVCIDF